jgi:hypothetical protein
MKLDRYARDYALWRDSASINYTAATTLFDTGDPLLMFPAATLGHHALEMYLKAGLIANGMTVFNPKDLKKLDAGITLATADCAWGHNLVTLAETLARRNPAFDVSKQFDVVGYLTIKEPLTIREGLAIFDPFFSELRYPQEMKTCDGLGGEDRDLLDALVAELRHARFTWNNASFSVAGP